MLEQNFEEPLYWLLSTVPQTLAAAFAILVAVRMPHILAFNDLILRRMEEIHSFWSSRDIENHTKFDLAKRLNDGDTPGFLKLAKEVGDAYGLPEHDDAGPFQNEAKRMAAEGMFRRRRERLKETTTALSVVGFTILWSLALLPFTPFLSAPRPAIVIIAFTLVLAVASIVVIAVLAKKTLSEF